jgi:hypothetical protein
MMRQHITHSRLLRSPVTYWGVVGLIWLAVVTVISMRLAPSVIEQGRDSGIFAYTAWVFREGGVLYQDAWENKPPGIFFVDALAFVLFGTNRWALWLIEVFSLFLTAVAMFWVLNRVFQRWLVAWTGTLVLVFMSRHSGLVWDTNFTEVFALLPQVLCFALGYQFLRQPNYKTAFLIGLAASWAFLLKQTTVGMALAFVPAILITRHPVVSDPRRWKWLGTIILGGLTGLGVVVLYLAANGVIDIAYDASFVSPRALHEWIGGEEQSGLVDAFIYTVAESPVPGIYGPLAPFVGVGILAALRRVLVREYPDHTAATTAALAGWALVALPLDLLLSNITGRGYEHYYVTLLPSGVLLIAFGLAWILGIGIGPRWLRGLAALGIWGFLLVASGSRPLEALQERMGPMGWDIFRPTRDEYYAEYIDAHTNPDDTVWVWGASSAFNFQAQRYSPTQYHYAYALIVPGYTTEEQIQETVHDLETNQPPLIIDDARSTPWRVPPLDQEWREAWWRRGGRRDLPNLDPIYQFVADHCTPVQERKLTMIFECTY